MTKHQILRVRREPVRRRLTVASTQFVTPSMLRIHFTSSHLEDFDSSSPDDHIKIFLPERAGHPAAMRDFTPRAWNSSAGTMTLDFALHEAGPAVAWARAARPGDLLDIGGPRGSTVVPDDFDWYLLIGDATALPSFGRRMEELRARVPAHVIALVGGADERQEWTSVAHGTTEWISALRQTDLDTAEMIAAADRFQRPQGDGFIWIATESAQARALFQHVTGRLGHPREWVKTAGYWSRGQADGGARLE